MLRGDDGGSQIPHRRPFVVGLLLISVLEDAQDGPPSSDRLVPVAVIVVDQAHLAGCDGAVIHAGHGTLPVMPAPLIWHITALSAWEAAVRDGAYAQSTRGRDLDRVGFVHACWPEQVSMVAKRVYPPDRPDDLVILEIDVARVEPPASPWTSKRTTTAAVAAIRT